MTDRDSFSIGVGVVAVGLVAAYWLWPIPESAPVIEGDGPGPNLVIEVAGETEGMIVIDLFDALAPENVGRIVELTRDGRYDGIVFHRVIPDFMAQTGDIEFGQSGADLSRAGQGGSGRPDLPPEFSDQPFERGVVGMARREDPASANSQFFIVTAPARHLDGQYTAVGRVISGIEVVDTLKAGSAGTNGAVENPDFIASARIEE